MKKPMQKNAPKRVVRKKSMPAKAKVKAKGKAASVRAKTAKRRVPQTKKRVSVTTAERRRRLPKVESPTSKTSMADSPEYIPEAMKDSLAVELGEAVVSSETSGDQEAENIRDEKLDEEDGGPFVETSARQEFAAGSDASNPEDAKREPFPTANA